MDTVHANERLVRVAMKRFEPAAAAAALALGIVTFTFAVQPWSPSGNDLDAIANEWLIWFAVLYLSLVGASALLQRLAPALRREPGRKRRGRARNQGLPESDPVAYGEPNASTNR